MQKIPLTQNQYAVVDDDDYEFLSKKNWSAQWSPFTESYYAVSEENGKRIHMHAIVNKTPLGMQTDHVDRNTLNNCKSNLRSVTASQNNMNKDKQKNNTSGFKGVVKHGNNWRARIKINKKLYSLGTFKTPEEAAQAYDDAAKKYFKDFAILNFK